MAGFKEYQMLFQLNASLGSNYSSTFTSGSKAISDLQNKIEGLNRTQNDISAYEKQQGAVENCRTKMELYKTQLENLKNATASNSVEEAKLANEIAAKEVQLQKATTAYDNANAKLADMGQKLREAGVDTSNLSAEEARLAAEAQNAAREQEALAQESAQMGASLKETMEGAAAALETAGLITGLKDVYSALAECSKASIEFESAMTGVSKTTDMSEQELQAMANAVMRLSTEIPVTTTELANVMEVAGQLGISKDNLLEFSTVMSQLATATTMTADEAATMLAQFANITQMDPSQYSNLASAVVDLGNNYATTEQKIVDMGQGIAAAGSLAGMSEADMMGLAAAVTSLGIETAAGSTSMSKLISQLNKAVETGEGLDEFADIAGMSASQFAEAWGTDAAGALAAFITGLNDVERNGKSAVVLLDELGIKEVRMQRMILSLVGSGDLMTNAIKTANDAFRENTALTVEAEKRYATTESRLTMMQNAANNVKIAIGDALNPALGAAADAATGLLRPVAEFIEQNPALVQGITAFVSVLGTAAIAITGYTAVTKLAAAASALLGGAIPGIGIILGVAAGIGVLVTAISALSGPAQTASEKMGSLNSEYDGLMDQISNDQNVIDLCDRYLELSERLNDATLSSEELKAIQIELEATGDALIAASDGRITSLEGETEAINAAVEAEKALAIVRQAEARQQAMNNLRDQAELYADAVKEFAESSERLAEIQDKLVNMSSVDDVGAKLTKTYEELRAALAETGGATTSEVRQLFREMEELYTLASGSGWAITFGDNIMNVDNAMRKLNITTEDLTYSQNELGREMGEAAASADAASAVMQEFVNNAVDAVTRGGMSIEEVRALMAETFSGYYNSAALVDEAMAQIEEAIASMASTADDASGSVEGLNDQMESIEDARKATQSAINAINAKLKELQEEYDKAYESAYNNIDGQIGLFSEMSYEVDTSIGEMIMALQSQSSYMEEYATNLQEAARRGVDEGLLKALSDGSTESAAYLATIVRSGDDAIADLNEAFKSVQEGKDSFAKTVAEMETDFAERTDGMQKEAQELQDMLNGLDGSGAGASLGETLAAGIRSKIADVQRAAAELRAAAEIDDSNSSARTGMNANNDAHMGITRAYASGTMDAKRGLALVGEEGPELMWMNGGERIATAEETARIARQATMEASPLNANAKNTGGNVYRIEVKPEYNVSGSNLSEKELQRIMGNNTQNLRIEVERILDDIQSDKARSVYV